jgi:hypothetical protein
MSKGATAKLTDLERTTIVNALTLAVRQYEIDAERASELALHGMTVLSCRSTCKAVPTVRDRCPRTRR